jgi:3-oxoacyl-[acyl-carrier protein] reductase
MDLGLADRVYVLTGASRGLGFASARCLVDDGARVVVSPSADRVEAAVSALGGPSRARGVVAGLGEPECGERLVDEARSAFGRLDGALLSVGGPPHGGAASLTDEQWRSMFETVFLGAVRAARVVGSALSAGGAIGFVLSTSARQPMPGLGLSNGFRPGLAMVAKELADEWGAHGVRVVGLLPGRLLTGRNKELLGASRDALESAARQIPLRRLGEPAEFGRVAAFLLSPAASYLTGLSVPVDGGAVRTL